MKIEYKVIVLSIIFGLLIWVIDAALDAGLFYDRSFGELLITNVPIHEVYIRSIILATFIVFGILISIVMAKRKSAELTLRENERTYRTIINNLRHHFLYIHDTKGIFKYVSPSVREILGYSEDDFYTHYTEYLTDNPINQAVMNHTDLSIQGIQQKPYEVEIFHKDGSIRLLEVMETPIVDSKGQVTAVEGIAQDITDRKKAEEEIRLERDRTQHYLDVAGVMFVVLDADQKVTLINQKGCIITGYTEEEITGRNWFDLCIPESEKDKVKAAHKMLMDGKIEPIEYFENPIITKNGQEKVVSWHNTVLRDNKGAIIGTLSSGEDITERKQAEEELSKYRLHLEELVQQRTAELAAANKELESFCYSVSHDLQAPLRAVHGFGQALVEDHAHQLDEPGKICVERIQAASRRMAQLIDDLLNLSRLTRTELHREKVNLSALAWKIASELKQTQPQRDVILVIAKDIYAYGDPRLLQIVMDNLLGNAWKFTSQHPHAKIEFGVTRYVDKEAYFVRDDGAGFDMTYADKLFSPFQRMHNANGFEGNGIGLPTVQRIINRHGGQIWAEAKVEQGATLYFTLPTEYHITKI